MQALNKPLGSSQPENVNFFFQAIGKVKGEIEFGKLNTITIQGKKYSLGYRRDRFLVFQALKLEVQNTGNAQQTLIVYPRFTHFPQRDALPVVSFQLVGFESKESHLSLDLDPMKFQISGLWQFLQCSRLPCISVYRNFSKELLEQVKQGDVLQKTRLLRANHLPVKWRDSCVAPYRFNPKAKEKRNPYFLAIQAVFSPQFDSFLFHELISLPTQEIPSYMKLRKQDKAAASRQKRINNK